MKTPTATPGHTAGTEELAALLSTVCRISTEEREQHGRDATALLECHDEMSRLYRLRDDLIAADIKQAETIAALREALEGCVEWIEDNMAPDLPIPVTLRIARAGRCQMSAGFDSAVEISALLAKETVTP